MVRKSRNARKADYTSLDLSVGYLIRKTFRVVTEVLEDKLAEHELSSSMWYFLRLLWQQDGRTQKQLSAELHLTEPTTVVAMDNLERRGLIVRKRNTSDRRKTNIYLTPAGKKLKEEIERYAQEVNEILLEDLTASEIETLRHLLQTIGKSAERYWAVQSGE